MRKQPTAKKVEVLVHKDALRPNIPSAEHEPLKDDKDKSLLAVAYRRRNRDLDPQLV